VPVHQFSPRLCLLWCLQLLLHLPLHFIVHCLQDQALQQGGMFVFDGPRCVFSHFDQATGAHADLGEVLGIAQQLGGSLAASAAAASVEDCGCEEPVGQK
jgi:hypothetical protein